MCPAKEEDLSPKNMERWLLGHASGAPMCGNVSGFVGNRTMGTLQSLSSEEEDRKGKAHQQVEGAGVARGMTGARYATVSGRQVLARKTHRINK